MSSRFAFEWTPRRRKIVRDMMKNGDSAGTIALALGCSRDTVLRHLDSPAPKER